MFGFSELSYDDQASHKLNCNKCGAIVCFSQQKKHDDYHFYRGENTDISELDLSIRSHNRLVRFGITTVEELIAYIEEHSNGNSLEPIYDIHGIGFKGANDIGFALAKFGYPIKGLVV